MQGVGTQREEFQGTARWVAGLNYPGVRQERHSQGLDAILGVLGMRCGEEGHISCVVPLAAKFSLLMRLHQHRPPRLLPAWTLE